MQSQKEFFNMLRGVSYNQTIDCVLKIEKEIQKMEERAMKMQIVEFVCDGCGKKYAPEYRPLQVIFRLKGKGAVSSDDFCEECALKIHEIITKQLVKEVKLP